MVCARPETFLPPDLSLCSGSEVKREGPLPSPGMPDTANENTGCLVKFGSQSNNKDILSVSMSSVAWVTFVPKNSIHY